MNNAYELKNATRSYKEFQSLCRLCPMTLRYFGDVSVLFSTILVEKSYKTYVHLER